MKTTWVKCDVCGKEEQLPVNGWLHIESLNGGTQAYSEDPQDVCSWRCLKVLAGDNSD